MARQIKHAVPLQESLVSNRSNGLGDIELGRDETSLTGLSRDSLEVEGD
jgi:hypothetical protein